MFGVTQTIHRFGVSFPLHKVLGMTKMKLKSYVFTMNSNGKIVTVLNLQRCRHGFYMMT